MYEIETCMGPGAIAYMVLNLEGRRRKRYVECMESKSAWVLTHPAVIAISISMVITNTT
jgi:hypothetical protein